MASSTTIAKYLLIFYIAFSSHLKVNADVSLEIDEDVSKFESVYHESVERIGSGNSLFIRSNIPVTVLQYRHNFHDFDRLVYPGQAVVFIKSHCTDDESSERFDPSIVVDTFNPRLSTETVLFVNAELSRNHENNEILPASSFLAEWDSYDRKCDVLDPIEGEQPEPVPPTSPSKGDGLDGYNFIGGVTNTIVSNLRPQRERTEEDEDDDDETKGKLNLISAITSIREEQDDSSCSIAAEVLYDSCAHSLAVDAPLLQVYEHKEVVNETMRADPDQDCNVIKNGILRFHTKPLLINGTRPPYTVGQSNPRVCSQVVVGRPFFDDEGEMIQAEAQIVHESDWKPTETVEKSITDKMAETEIHSSYATDWTFRALGEHASIASFAAFTIALMTNNAPSSLIEDSLVAALDEVRHARTSFDMASLLLKQQVEPTALPPTSLNFAHDIESLALAAAREGCVDETISALLAAAEVQHLSNENSVELPFGWKEKVEVIAKEEARHSALAWRTIHWACSEDDRVCDLVMHFFSEQLQLDHFDSSDLDGKLKTSLRSNFSNIMYELMQLVSSQGYEKVNIKNETSDDLIGEVATLIIGYVDSALKSEKVLKDPNIQVVHEDLNVV